nr:MAG TPA: hypothetical protein [Caudoviricetes sp.]
MNQEKAESSNLSISIFSRTGGGGVARSTPSGLRPSTSYLTRRGTSGRDSDQATRFALDAFSCVFLSASGGLLESRGLT